jgi:5'-nucleotidase / UDP-sugar diphosphatase
MRKVLGLSVGLLLTAGLMAALLHAGPAGAAPLSTANAQLQETSFGDLATDALCDAAGVTIGLIGAKNLRPGTIEGEVTEAKVRDLLSLPDEPWAVSRLTGLQIRQAMERSLGMLPRENIAFLQVSGLSVVYNPTGPRNARVVAIRNAAGPLAEQQTYEVVMPVSLAKGGSGYFQLFNEENITRRSDQGMTAAIMARVSAKGAAAYTGQGRISPEPKG